jgi:hypothetical protein
LGVNGGGANGGYGGDGGSSNGGRGGSIHVCNGGSSCGAGPVEVG